MNMEGGQRRSEPGWRRVVAWITARQIPMAGSAAAILFASSHSLGRPLSIGWYFAAFFGTWCVYLRDSAASCDAEDTISQPERAAAFQRNVRWRILVPAIAAMLALLAVVLARPHAMAWGVLIAIGALGLLHATQGTRRENGETPARLKSLAIMKSIVVSAAWTVGAVALPMLEGTPLSESNGTTPLPLAVLLFLALLLDSLLLDLRDRIADRTYGLRTIAVRIGPRGIHALAGLLILAMVITGLVGVGAFEETGTWRRFTTAVVLGLSIPWAAWRRIVGNETATNLGMMAWRYLAAAAVIGSAPLGGQ